MHAKSWVLVLVFVVAEISQWWEMSCYNWKRDQSYNVKREKFEFIFTSKTIIWSPKRSKEDLRNIWKNYFQNKKNFFIASSELQRLVCLLLTSRCHYKSIKTRSQTNLSFVRKHVWFALSCFPLSGQVPKGQS